MRFALSFWLTIRPVVSAFDKSTEELVLRLGCGGKAYLDLFEAYLQKHPVELYFFL